MSATARDPRLLLLLVDLVALASVEPLRCRWCGGWRAGAGDRCAGCGAGAPSCWRAGGAQ